MKMQDVSDTKNVCTTKSWADVCNSSVVFNSSAAHTTAHASVVEKIDVEELRERDRRSKNIVIQGIAENENESPPSLAISIEDFFQKQFGMSEITVYGAHRVGKPGAIRSGERPIVCSMADETKRKIIPE